MKRQIKETIAEIGKRLYEKGLNGSYGGNFSIRDNEDIYITPSGIPKDIIEYNDVLVIDFNGNVVEGEGEPSSETPFHIKIYEVRQDVNAIIHAHPPYATGFAIAHVSIPNNIHEESALVVGEVPVLPYEVTSSKELAERVGDAIKNHNALLLSNHGALTVGEDMEKAFRRMEELELLARMISIAYLLGGPKPIPEEKLKILFEKKKPKI